MYFEHKALYRSLSAEIPDDPYEIEIGKAKIVSEGEDLTIITYGMGVHWAKEIMEAHPHINAELIDLRSLCPLDTETIFNSVNKTGKALVLHEDSITGGIGGEIVALISENCFQKLDGPVMRCGSLDTPVPFAKALEKHYLPIDRFKLKFLELYEY